MARIDIKDLDKNESLDADALKRVRGGTLNFTAPGSIEYAKFEKPNLTPGFLNCINFNKV